MKFQIAHLYEVQNKHKAARESYDFILSNRDVSLELKADIYRQLGKNLTRLQQQNAPTANGYKYKQT